MADFGVATSSTYRGGYVFSLRLEIISFLGSKIHSNSFPHPSRSGTPPIPYSIILFKVSIKMRPVGRISVFI